MWSLIQIGKVILLRFRLQLIRLEIIFRKEIIADQNPAAKLAEKEKEYSEKFANPYLAAEYGFIDEIIEPSQTRKKLITAFDMLKNKVDVLPQKKHGNIPL